MLIPRLSGPSPDAIPYYHPKVAGLAFEFTVSGSAALMVVHVLPLDLPKDGIQIHYPPDSRTYRIALTLLNTLLRYGKGQDPDKKYVKRVHHDTLIRREQLQDLYLVLKEKYTWIINEWREQTDPLKHVFEVST